MVAHGDNPSIPCSRVFGDLCHCPLLAVQFELFFEWDRQDSYTDVLRCVYLFVCCVLGLVFDENDRYGCRNGDSNGTIDFPFCGHDVPLYSL